MKTQQELMQAYWGPGGTVDMVNEYNAKHGCDVKPWECVRNSLIHIGYKEHPTFIDRADPKNNGESCPVFKERKE